MALPVDLPIGPIECLDAAGQRYRVIGQTGIYHVSWDGHRWCCTCHCWAYRCAGQAGAECKHIGWVRESWPQAERCAPCGGAGWLRPSPLMLFVDRQGKRDRAPAACVECAGSGRRSQR
jgi:hypothetical protein